MAACLIASAADRDPLQPLPRPLHRGLHGGVGQVRPRPRLARSTLRSSGCRPRLVPSPRGAVRADSRARPRRRRRAGARRLARRRGAARDPASRGGRRHAPAPSSTTMRTPGDDEELAAGLLFAEGVLAGREDLLALDRPTDPRIDPELRRNVLVATLSPEAFARAAKALRGDGHGLRLRRLRQDVDRERDPARGPAAAHVRTPRSPPEILVRASRARCGERQSIFARTGGLHAAGLFDADGALRARSARTSAATTRPTSSSARLPAARRAPALRPILMVSGRPGFEIVQKAFAAGIPIVASVSAPSSLAVELAETGGVTLVGFLRERRFNVYSHPRADRRLTTPLRQAVSRLRRLPLTSGARSSGIPLVRRLLRLPRGGGPDGTHSSRIPEGHDGRRNLDRARLRRLDGRGRDARVQDLAHDRDAKHLSLLRGLLRRDHPHARRQGEERDGRPSSTSRAIPTIRSTAARSAPRAPRSGTTSTTRTGCLTPEGAPAGLRQVGGHLLGRGDREDRAPHQGHARPDASSRRTRRARSSTATPGIGDDRRLHRHQRVQLPPVEGHHGPGGAVPGQPGPGLTRPHGGQFGRHVRARGDDQRMGRHQERRRHPRDGRQSRGEPSRAASSGSSRRRRRATRSSSSSIRASRAPPRSPTSTRRSAPGTDIAFLLGIIRYALETSRFHEDYVKLHTNAPYLISEKFGFDDGLFTGFDEASRQLRQGHLGLRGRREDEGATASTRRCRTRAASSSS